MASDFEDLRRELTEAIQAAGNAQAKSFLDTSSITVEYSLLGHLKDLLHTATMLTHTIDRVRFDERRTSDQDW